MGYDMRWRKADPSEVAAVAAANAVFDQAAAARDALPKSAAGVINAERARETGDWESHEAYDGRTPEYCLAQDTVHAAYEAFLDARSSYFRLNVWGMSRYAPLMEGIGMIFEDDPCPPFPEPADYGTTWDDAEALKYREDYPDRVFTDSEMVVILKFRAEVDRVLDFHGRADTPGIPAHKFSTNDGWHVLPAECRAAVRIWQDWVRERGETEALAVVAEHVGDTSYWLKWIAYIAGAATHDGFEVH